jgi:hypothetical protein
MLFDKLIMILTYYAKIVVEIFNASPLFRNIVESQSLFLRKRAAEPYIKTISTVYNSPFKTISKMDFLHYISEYHAERISIVIPNKHA